MKPRHTPTARRRLMVLLVIGQLSAAPLIANDASGRDHRHGVQKTKTSCREPEIAGKMSAKDTFALKIAYRGAIKRLEKLESCRALFDDLNMDGFQALGTSQYLPVQSDAERAYCARGVHAYTAVGHDQIMICRYFHVQGERIKVAVLIHEALHTAGMAEAPSDPAAMTAEEITEMVERACALR